MYGIILNCGSDAVRLMHRDEQEIAKLKAILTKLVVCTDFFKKYEMKDLLGEGAFSQVYRVI